MKNKIIEIVELGEQKSLIHRENEPITELIQTTDLVDELNQQLRIGGIVNEAEKKFSPCGLGHNTCKCKVAHECGYGSEVKLCEHILVEDYNFTTKRHRCILCNQYVKEHN